MREANLRWVGRHSEKGKLGVAFRLPNDTNEKSHAWDALVRLGYDVIETRLYVQDHEDYPGYKVVEAKLADESVVTMYATEVATA